MYGRQQYRGGGGGGGQPPYQPEGYPGPGGYPPAPAPAYANAAHSSRAPARYSDAPARGPAYHHGGSFVPGPGIRMGDDHVDLQKKQVLAQIDEELTRRREAKEKKMWEERQVEERRYREEERLRQDRIRQERERQIMVVEETRRREREFADQQMRRDRVHEGRDREIQRQMLNRQGQGQKRERERRVASARPVLKNPGMGGHTPVRPAMNVGRNVYPGGHMPGPMPMSMNAQQNIMAVRRGAAPMGRGMGPAGGGRGGGMMGAQGQRRGSGGAAPMHSPAKGNHASVGKRDDNKKAEKSKRVDLHPPRGLNLAQQCWNLVDLTRHFAHKDINTSCDLTHVVLRWLDEDQQEAVKSLGLYNVVPFHRALDSSQATKPTPPTPPAPTPDTQYQSKVMLMSGFSPSTIPSLFDARSSPSVSQLLSFLVAFMPGNNHTSRCIGGDYHEDADGPDPSSHPQSLINTAIRTCKAMTTVDLSQCTTWLRFMDIHYARPAEVVKGVSYPERKCVTVIWIPNIWDHVPAVDDAVSLYQRIHPTPMFPKDSKDSKEPEAAAEDGSTNMDTDKETSVKVETPASADSGGGENVVGAAKDAKDAPEAKDGKGKGKGGKGKGRNPDKATKKAKAAAGKAAKELALVPKGDCVVYSRREGRPEDVGSGRCGEMRVTTCTLQSLMDSSGEVWAEKSVEVILFAKFFTQLLQWNYGNDMAYVLRLHGERLRMVAQAQAASLKDASPNTPKRDGGGGGGVKEDKAEGVEEEAAEAPGTPDEAVVDGLTIDVVQVGADDDGGEVAEDEDEQEGGERAGGSGRRKRKVEPAESGGKKRKVGNEVEGEDGAGGGDDEATGADEEAAGADEEAGGADEEAGGADEEAGGANVDDGSKSLEEYEGMLVKDLKAACKDRGLNQKGNKKELARRIFDWDAAQTSQPGASDEEQGAGVVASGMQEDVEMSDLGVGGGGLVGEEGDEILNCRDCDAQFIFSVGEQEFFKSKGLENKPTRCAECKAAKKARFDEGGGGATQMDEGGATRMDEGEATRMDEGGATRMDKWGATQQEEAVSVGDVAEGGDVPMRDDATAETGNTGAEGWVVVDKGEGGESDAHSTAPQGDKAKVKARLNELKLAFAYFLDGAQNMDDNVAIRILLSLGLPMSMREIQSQVMAATEKEKQRGKIRFAAIVEGLESLVARDLARSHGGAV